MGSRKTEQSENYSRFFDRRSIRTMEKIYAKWSLIRKSLKCLDFDRWTHNALPG